MKSGNLNFLEPSGPLQACKGTASPLPLLQTVPQHYVGTSFAEFHPHVMKYGNQFTPSVKYDCHLADFHATRVCRQLFAKNFTVNLQNALVVISENTVAADIEREQDETDGLAVASATVHPLLATTAQK
jgi:hypothetical protein